MRYFIIAFMFITLICFGCQKQISIAEENPKLISTDIPDTLKQGITRDYLTELMQFSGRPIFEYFVADSARVLFLIRDILKRPVDTLVNQPQLPGIYSVKWINCERRNSGFYFLELHINDFVETKRVIWQR